MSDVVTTTKERVLEAAGKCSTAKETLKTLFPDVFKEEWIDITSLIEVRMEKGECWFARLYYRGEKIGNFVKWGVKFGDADKYRAYHDECAIKIEKRV